MLISKLEIMVAITEINLMIPTLLLQLYVLIKHLVQYRSLSQERTYVAILTEES